MHQNLLLSLASFDKYPWLWRDETHAACYYRIKHWDQGLYLQCVYIFTAKRHRILQCRVMGAICMNLMEAYWDCIHHGILQAKHNHAYPSNCALWNALVYGNMWLHTIRVTSIICHGIQACFAQHRRHRQEVPCSEHTSCLNLGTKNDCPELLLK